MTIRWGWVLFAVLAGILALANILAIVPGLTTTRLWEDEAFNLTVPVNLLAGLGYTSDGTLSGSILAPFDERISTGPVMLLPIALVLAFGADPVIGGRVVALLFWMLLLAGLFVLGRAVAGAWGGLLAAAVPLGLNLAQRPSPVQGPTDILGEVPAAALIVWAVIAARRRPWLGGLLLGLAAQTKFIAWLAVPALVVFVLFAPRDMGWRRRILRVAPPTFFALVPTVAYELVKLLSLGLDEYIWQTRLYVRFLRWGGQDNITAAPAEKAALLLEQWFVPGIAALIIALVAVAGVAVAWLRISEDDTKARALYGDPDAPAAAIGGPVTASAAAFRSGDPRDWTRRQIAVLGIAAIVGVGTYTAWFLVSQHTPAWIRQPSVGLLAFAPMIAAVAWRGWSDLCRNRTPLVCIGGIAGATVLVIGAVFGIAGHLVAPPMSDQQLADQRADAQQIAEAMGTDARVGVGGGLPSAGRSADAWIAVPWSGAVSIVFLSGSHVGLIGEDAMTGEPYIARGEAPEGCDPLVQVEPYVVCAGATE